MGQEASVPEGDPDPGPHASVPLAPGDAGLQAAINTAAKSAPVGAVTGRYHRLPKKLEDDYSRTGKVLGSGYNGEVFMAVRKENNTPVAVKGFRLHGIGKDKKHELENEAALFLGMDHPHVVRLLDCYESTEVLSLVMECCTGGEVFNRVVSRKRFTEKMAVTATWQMLLALSYIHSHNIVHRDIKLENYLYESPESDFLKLADFGFSKVWATNTKLHLSCGTLAYMAPEVLNQNYNSQCDLWSLGVAVFIMLLGYLPFSGNEDAQERDIMRGRFEKKKMFWDKISHSAQDFIQKLLVVDPKKRLTARQALQHPWIEKRNHMNDDMHDVSEGIVVALATFAQASEFRRACMSMMAWSLTNEERKQLNDAFMEIDTDRSGTISIREFKRVVQEWYHIDDGRVAAAFESLDTNHADEIHYSEFLAAMVSFRIQVHDDLLKQTFKHFDTDDNGYITKDDLREVLGDVYGGQRTPRLVEEADSNHDGKITYNEFVRFIKEGQAHQREAAEKLIDTAQKHPDNTHKASRMKRIQAEIGGPVPAQGKGKGKGGDRKGKGCCTLM